MKNIVSRNVKKIALIRPGRSSEGLIVPLGLLYLAAYVNMRMPEIEFIVIDAFLENLSPQEIAARVKTFKADVVALTGLTAYAAEMRETAKFIRTTCPQALILAGGPALSSDYTYVLEERSIDFGVIGEGEETFYQILLALRLGQDISLLDGLVYNNHKGELIVNKSRATFEDLDVIGRPAYHLISVENYFKSSKRTSASPVYISKRNLPVITSRGCPYRCIYCHNIFGKTFRPRSVDSVVDEIIWLKNTYTIDELEIIDDIFNFDKERAKQIMRKIIAANLGLSISFPIGIKYEMIDDELLDLFKQAGVFRLAFGIESANARIQNVLKKTVDLGRMNEIIDKSIKRNFFVSGFFQLGLPGETKQEMLDTVNYAVSTNLHTATFHLTVPFPGTEMYEKHVKGKFTFPQSASCRDVSVNVSMVEDKELLGIRKYATYKFYCNTKRLANIYKIFPVKKRLFFNFINLLSEMIFRKWLINT